MNRKLLEAKKNHHYVWAHHLSQWSENGRDVWHTTPTQKVVLHSVRDIAKEDYFYAVGALKPDHLHLIEHLFAKSPDHLKEQHKCLISGFLTIQFLELVYRESGSEVDELNRYLDALKCNTLENLHADHELKTKPIIDKLLRGEEKVILEDNDSIEFYAFFGQQIARTRSFKDAWATVAPISQKMGPDAILVHSTIKDCWWLVSYLFGLNIGWSLFASRHRDRHCLLVNENELAFITSDQPVINVHKDLVRDSVGAPDDEVCDFFFPLGPRAAYMINKSDIFKSGKTSVPMEFVEEMNVKMAESSTTHIIGSDFETVSRYKRHVGTRGRVVTDFVLRSED